ncbi:GMC oxidoreductase-domain-containing protein [Fomitopsis serialis]|uniref:GMC oxidoreductase-domain-containing protein n=1 Tax=Fomitopsis serialis TaxID=139415 RepID=UPI0020080D62|nr:GMC oxidoreductase-domain-containing protein [Neoantrodia serialis]KAH9921137.1 GMC oxidoreductase-domain-containing protein [Neoantrodia serialis]
MSNSPSSEVDIIIAGGGTSGLVIASRLAEADPTLSILVLEAGPPTQEDPAHTQPARYLSHLLPGSKTVRVYEGRKTEELGGRGVVVPCGQCLGGGSSVNFTVYARPAASDFDDWETTYGNPGWGSKDLIPLLKKSETYQAEGSAETHGYSGPLKVSYGGLFTNIGQQFLEVAARYDAKRSLMDDPNGLFKCNAYGVSTWIYISADDGRRSDVPHYYIYNRTYPKLEILTGYLVKRVIFEGTRAVGVEYTPNARFQPDEKQGTRIAKAKRLVLLSAGAFGTPAILERSGIGAPALLKKLEIEPLVDLPGVGENYQDHQVIFAPYLVKDEAETLDGIVRNDPEEVENWSAQWTKDGSGLMAHNGIDAAGKLRPFPDELELIGPQFRERWETYFKDVPDKPVIWCGAVSEYVGDPSTVPKRKYASIGYYVQYPMSTGYVHITSANDVSAAPDFDPRFLHRVEDLVLLRWGYKHSREFARRMPLYCGEYLPSHPQFPEGSQASCSSDGGPVAMDAPLLQYTSEDDQAIDEYSRRAVQTSWHSLGTCAMKPRGQGGVVDSRLNVYGVTGLKVADMSIVPSNVCALSVATRRTLLYCSGRRRESNNHPDAGAGNYGVPYGLTMV